MQEPPFALSTLDDDGLVSPSWNCTSMTDRTLTAKRIIALKSFETWNDFPAPYWHRKICLLIQNTWKNSFGLTYKGVPLLGRVRKAEFYLTSIHKLWIWVLSSYQKYFEQLLFMYKYHNKSYFYVNIRCWIISQIFFKIVLFMYTDQPAFF